jgi:hypothetical protein
MESSVRREKDKQKVEATLRVLHFITWIKLIIFIVAYCVETSGIKKRRK